MLTNTARDIKCEDHHNDRGGQGAFVIAFTSRILRYRAAWAASMLIIAMEVRKPHQVSHVL